MVSWIARVLCGEEEAEMGLYPQWRERCSTSAMRIKDHLYGLEITQKISLTPVSGSLNLRDCVPPREGPSLTSA